MTHAHLGVVDDGHQHVVELVRGGADQLAQGSQLLGLGKLLLEDIDLLLETGPVGVTAGTHGSLPTLVEAPDRQKSA